MRQHDRDTWVAQQMQAAARRDHNLYTAGFDQWLADNRAIAAEFSRQAHRVLARGRDHYSARTIVEVMRHESALAEVGPGAGEWKINNNRIPDLARSWMAVTGIALFEVRNQA